MRPLNFSGHTSAQISHRQHSPLALDRLFGNAHQGANMSSPVFAFFMIVSGFGAYLCLFLGLVK